MVKPVLSKELFLMGLTPADFERVLQTKFAEGGDIRVFRELLQMDQPSFAAALGISVEFLQTMEIANSPPSDKFRRRLMKATERPDKFYAMD